MERMTHILQFPEHKLWLKEMLSFECHRHTRAVEAKLENLPRTVLTGNLEVLSFSATCILCSGHTELC
jgi:hypothetical protein